MSPQEAAHVSLMKRRTTSGKGALGTWWSLRQEQARLDKTEHSTATRARDEAKSKPVVDGVHANQRLNLVAKGEAHRRKAKALNRTLRNSAVRDYRGASGNV